MARAAEPLPLGQPVPLRQPLPGSRPLPWPLAGVCSPVPASLLPEPCLARAQHWPGPLKHCWGSEPTRSRGTSPAARTQSSAGTGSHSLPCPALLAAVPWYHISTNRDFPAPWPFPTNPHPPVSSTALFGTGFLCSNNKVHSSSCRHSSLHPSTSAGAWAELHPRGCSGNTIGKGTCPRSSQHGIPVPGQPQSTAQRVKHWCTPPSHPPSCRAPSWPCSLTAQNIKRKNSHPHPMFIPLRAKSLLKLRSWHSHPSHTSS